MMLLTCLRTLAAECSEYFVQHQDGDQSEVDTTSMEMEGRTFVFSVPRLLRLQHKLHRILGQDAEPPSLYVCLASLTFAHVYRVRMASQEGPLQTDLHDHAKLVTPIDQRSCCCRNETAEYFGNTVLTQMTEIPQQELCEACSDGSLRALARLTVRITNSLATVDQKAVLKQDVLAKKMSDPRQLILDIDAHHAHELHFDTWRSLGDESSWNIPGTTTDRPDAIRRVPGGCSRPGAVILPATSNSEIYEVQLVLPLTSM